MLQNNDLVTIKHEEESEIPKELGVGEILVEQEQSEKAVFGYAIVINGLREDSELNRHRYV